MSKDRVLAHYGAMAFEAAGLPPSYDRPALPRFQPLSAAEEAAQAAPDDVVFDLEDIESAIDDLYPTPLEKRDLLKMLMSFRAQCIAEGRFQRQREIDAWTNRRLPEPIPAPEVQDTGWGEFEAAGGVLS